VEFAHQATNIVTRQRFGRLTYPFAAFKVLKDRQALNITLRLEGLASTSKATEQPLTTTSEHDSIMYSGRVLQISAINAPIFGGMWQLSIPGASLYDRLLDIIIIEEADPASLSDEIAHLFRRPMQQPTQKQNNLTELQRAELTGIPGIHHVRARAIAISTVHDPQDITLDGEVRSQTPAYVRMADKQLAVFSI
jgi:diacylglycerol kinase (ATP)